MAMIDEHTKEEVRKFLRERLPATGSARLVTFSTGADGSGCEFCDQVRALASELAEISSGRVLAEHHTLDGSAELAKRLRVKMAPATVVTNEKAELSMKFYGLPSGYEFAALLEDIVDAVSGSPSGLSERTLAELRSISKPVRIHVFVTPTCPYCPRAVRTAHMFSAANPAVVDAEMIESMEFPDLAAKYSVMAVPKVVINDRVEFEGALPERVFLYKLKEALRDGDGHS